MRHGEDEEEEGGGRKGGRKARMMIRIMASWALGIGRRRGKTAKTLQSWSLGGLLGPSWALWLKKRGGLNSRRPLGGSQMPSWGPLGPFLAALGAVLGLLGPLLGLSWANLGPS